MRVLKHTTHLLSQFDCSAVCFNTNEFFVLQEELHPRRRPFDRCFKCLSQSRSALHLVLNKKPQDLLVTGVSVCSVLLSYR
jgi:hypothetical protein